MTVTVLWFAVRGLSFELEADPYGGDHAAIYFTLELTHPTEAINQQGTTIPSKEWSLVVYDQASGTKFEKPNGGLGTVRYRPSSSTKPRPSCVLQMEVKASHFSRILASTHAGSPPKEIQVTVDGVEDSVDKLLWDMRKSAELKIVGVTFNAPMSTSNDRESDA